MFLLRRLARKAKTKLDKEKAYLKIIEDLARFEEQKRLDRIYIKKAVEQLLVNTVSTKSTYKI